MTEDSTAIVAESPKKAPIIMIAGISVVLFLASAAGSYVFLFKPENNNLHEAKTDDDNHHADTQTADSIATAQPYAGDHISESKRNEPSVYYTFDPITVSLGSKSSANHLRIGISLEIAESDYEIIERYEPKILDVLVTYLRAVTETDLRDASSMTRIKAQMLRRLRLVAHDTHIRALLFTEYLIN